MCYSLEVSRNSFIINIISSYILYKRRNNEYKLLSLFFSFVGLMQLYDWIFWMNQEENNINFIVTKIAMFSNHLQPIVLALLIMFYLKKFGKMSQILLLLYVICISIYTYTSYNNIDYTLIKNIPDINNNYNPSLYWQWNTKENALMVYIIFLMSFCVFGYENFSKPLNLIHLIINLSTFFFSDFFHKHNHVGRWWCNVAAYVPLLLLFVPDEKKVY